MLEKTHTHRIPSRNMQSLWFSDGFPGATGQAPHMTIANEISKYSSSISLITTNVCKDSKALARNWLAPLVEVGRD